jgi:hypothetical protein
MIRAQDDAAEPAHRLLEFLMERCGLAGEPLGHAVTRLMVQLLEAVPAHLDAGEYVEMLLHLRSYIAFELTEMDDEITVH